MDLSRGPIRDRVRWYLLRCRRGSAMRSRIAGGLLRCLAVGTRCRTSVAGHHEWRPCQRSSNFPHCLPSKVPRGPVFNEDQFSRGPVRPETRTERPKAGQESLSSLTFKRSHWRVGGAPFLEVTTPSCESRAWLIAPRLLRCPLNKVKEIFNADDQDP